MDRVIHHYLHPAHELKKYKLLSGIREEIEMVHEALKKGKSHVWAGKHSDPLSKSLRDGI